VKEGHPAMRSAIDSPRTPAAPSISLVIPIRNEEVSLRPLIASIFGQTRPPDEVVLVDGGSVDRTVELARELMAADPRSRVVEAGPATPGRGRNIGIVAARHDWIALTDAGICLDVNWLERLVEAAGKDPSVRVVYGNYEPVRESYFEECAALVYVPPMRHRDNGWMRGPFIASCLIHREVWEAVGGFPDLRAAEDLIFMERVEERGFATAWAPGASVRWRLQPTLARTFRKFALYSKHNVWAGRQRYWHHGLARQYLVGFSFVAMAVAHSPWWLALPFLGLSARVFKSVWVRRESRGPLWALNPLRLAGVGVILVTIDLATFIGWSQALLSPPAGCPANPAFSGPSEPEA
jgi:glycosyltransferase involved in cell wall biosynthesis